MQINSDLIKNTVKAENQIKEKIFSSNFYKDGFTVLFLGNSITLHGIKEDIGWHLECGMAASAPENDYVHLVLKHLKNNFTKVNHTVCNVADWERAYFDDNIIENFASAKQNPPDLSIIRLGENIALSNLEKYPLKPYLEKFCKFFKGARQTIVTDLFWSHSGMDKLIQEICTENGFTYCPIGDLGFDDENKAIGLFEHPGVAMHPGDLGMKRIAERIIDKINF